MAPMMTRLPTTANGMMKALGGPKPLDMVDQLLAEGLGFGVDRGGDRGGR
jgi:hypothetical protein